MKFIYALFMLLLMVSAFAQFSVDIEAGLAHSGYNDVKIPGKGNSNRFSFTKDLESDIVFSYRINLHYNINSQHRLSLLYAPLTIKPTGIFDRNIRFQDELFANGTNVKATYRFDSYRMQYRYYFKNQNWIIKGAGLTIKLRDAEIGLESQGQKQVKTNTGIVPLINFHLSQNILPELKIDLDGEALFSPYGRAADVLLSLQYDVNDKLTVKSGYRILEGGSNGDEVYTFALINYFVAGLIYKFD